MQAAQCICQCTGMHRRAGEPCAHLTATGMVPSRLALYTCTSSDYVSTQLRRPSRALPSAARIPAGLPDSTQLLDMCTYVRHKCGTAGSIRLLDMCSYARHMCRAAGCEASRTVP